MSRNVTILVIILVVILLATYLLWLRGKFISPQQAATITPVIESQPEQVTPEIEFKESTQSATITPTPTRSEPTVATKSGQTPR